MKPSNPIPNFFDLPPEIRDEIYRYLFSAHSCKIECEAGPFYRFDLRIFRVSRLMYAETSRVFHAENQLVIVETPWPQAETYVQQEGAVPIVAHGTVCESFKRAQLQINITSPDIERNATGKFLIHTNDVIDFCKLWFYSNLTYLEMNPHLHLELILTNQSEPGKPLHRDIQRRLTGPFGMIKNLGHFSVSGDVDADIQQHLQHEMSQPMDSPTRCIEKSMELLTAGDTLLAANKPNEALEAFKESFRAIHIVIDGKFDRRVYAERFFEALLARPLFGNQSAGIARFILRVKLVASVMLAYLQLEDWSVTFHWGMRSIRLYRRTLGEGADEPGDPSFPVPLDWGKIYYRTAVAAEKLERDNEAHEFYRIARAWLPNDETVRAGLNRISSRMGLTV